MDQLPFFELKSNGNIYVCIFGEKVSKISKELFFTVMNDEFK